MQTGKPLVAVFDTKPYDRDYLTAAAGVGDLTLAFHEFRLDANTAFAAAGAQAVCVFVNDEVHRDTLAALASQGVKFVALRCAGFNNVDLKAAKEFGISVTRVPSYSPHAVAEHTIALILTLNRKTHRAFVRVRELNFSLSGLVGFDLHGKTAGIIGTGKTGRIVAQILRGFGMKVLASDPYPNTDWAVSHGIEYTANDIIAAESDIISLHAPLTKETHHLVNREFIAKMKKGVMLVNVSRGRLIDTGELIEAFPDIHIFINVKSV